jgi:hypothetical protein
MALVAHVMPVLAGHVIRVLAVGIAVQPFVNSEKT